MTHRSYKVRFVFDKIEDRPLNLPEIIAVTIIDQTNLRKGFKGEVPENTKALFLIPSESGGDTERPIFLSSDPEWRSENGMANERNDIEDEIIRQLATQKVIISKSNMVTILDQIGGRQLDTNAED